MAMRFLVFQLHAPLASWGEPAVGEARGTAAYASQSAIIGLLGAALGVRRDDETAHAALRDGYGFAVALLQAGSLLRDFHTAQVPPRSALKGRPQSTRRQEMAVPKQELGTMLSTRDYRQNAACLVALQPVGLSTSPSFPNLEELAAALREPRFVLYLGRRACPPSAPLWPQIIEADAALAAFAAYAVRFDTARQGALPSKSRPLLEPLGAIQRLAFDEHVHAGVAAHLSTQRKDRLIRRQGWQFGDRVEHLALLAQEE